MTQSIRRQLRAHRRALTPFEQSKAKQGLARQAKRCARLLRAKRSVSYSAFDGEISPDLIELPHQELNCLPRIVNYHRATMQFVQASSARRNRFGILEPVTITKHLQANELDVILLPLVAFDRHGGRLGMGAGYYDRALQSLSHQTSTRPYLIGLAHYFQEVKLLEQAAWDVRLDAILTDREFIQIHPLV